MQNEEAARLRQRFDDEHAGHDGDAGEMPLKERLVEADAFVRLDVFPIHDFVNPVHKQERIAMGEKVQNPADVERYGLGHAVCSLKV